MNTIKSKKQEKKENTTFKRLVIIKQRKILGSKNVYSGLLQIYGVGHKLAQIIINELGLSATQKMGDLSDEKIEEIKNYLSSPTSVEKYQLNLQKDKNTGESLLLTEIDLVLKNKDSIETLKEIQSYRGIYHSRGKKVRAQKTRSNGRRNTVSQIKKAQPEKKVRAKKDTNNKNKK